MVKKRVVAAMSGGVDSSVAAAMLIEQGYEVIGVTLKLHECSEASDSPSCCGIDGMTKARAAANALGIRHYVYDCVKDFEKAVLERSWKEYDSGRTPNPCLLCNEYVKFGILQDFARSLHAEYVATGHYAQIGFINGMPVLKRGSDTNKDQSYFLAGLTGEQLRRSLFPLGGMDKPQVREYARSLNLPTAESTESQDACLVGGFESFAEMLRCRFGSSAKHGEIVTDRGEVMARHKGFHGFTVGQRRNLGLTTFKRFWVKEIDAANSRVIITDDQKNLLSPSIMADGFSWREGFIPADGFSCLAQIRYRHKPVKANVYAEDGGVYRIDFEIQEKAAAPGQAVVLYENDIVLGRGWIKGKT
ncbi:tRNA 2-thiouridine(34) synthase MnmA [Geovibrio thiophilus]|uniref:tRNA-specific 2-thiouridylase MnmA n=1 Tax=Geovibrio thiophilus TaxID=139438 RepID=A0A410JW72_9BACT|nr:tRNA 2-thiouridine(34) synthase MnmA [Geovibrio thiophilus]QAR32442.1 tRNA 2-thiouridine(34) synthase MnmA [Geovibrio thiophilus]